MTDRKTHRDQLREKDVFKPKKQPEIKASGLPPQLLERVVRLRAKGFSAEEIADGCFATHRIDLETEKPVRTESYLAFVKLIEELP